MDNLYEAYLDVYQELDEEKDKKMEGEDPCWDTHKMVGTKKKGGKEVPNCVPKEEFDLFDYLLEYLVVEGYANTSENAIAIMANMSEDWKQSIVEQELTARQKYLMGKVEKMNKEKSGSAFKHVPGKQNVGGALDRANRSAMQMRGEK